MTYTAEERAYLWLCACTDTDYRERVSLLRRAASPALLMEEAESFFGDVPPLSERTGQADDFCAYLDKRGYFAVTLLSPDYPEALKHIVSPPLVLYGAGKRELLSERKFCVVGSRITPPWAEKLGKSISGHIAEHFAVVTGFAEGGDAAAIAGALPKGKVICVLPCGLDKCYPAAHVSLKEKVQREGLLLSELLPGEQTKKYSFHARNRILAGLAEGVLVISAGSKSGALITADAALDFGRDVFAFPYNAGAQQGEGCNGLLKKGAYPVTEAEDVLSVYGIEEAKSEPVPLTEEEARVLAVLRESGQAHLTEIARRTGMEIYEISATLSALEIKGVAVKEGGNRYAALT